MQKNSTPSSNPYAQVLLDFSPIVGDPSPGYEGRLIFLGIIIGCIPVLATLLLVIHTIALRRKGEKLWLYKRIRREEGSYIVGARTPLLVILAYAVAATFAPALYYARKYTLSKGFGVEQFQSCIFSFWALFYPTAYLYSMANLSAWLVLTSALSPRVALAVFSSIFVICTIGLLGTAVYAIISVFSFRAASDAFMARIAAAAIQNATIISPVDEEAIAAFTEVLCTFYRQLSDIVFAVSTAPAPILIVNIASLALVLAVRRQVTERDNGTLERETNRKQLRAVEHALVVDSLFVAFWSISLMTISIWAAIYLRDVRNTSFAGVEATLFGVLWVGSAPLVIALLAHLIISWRNLPRQHAAYAETDKSNPTFRVSLQSFHRTQEKTAPRVRRESLLTGSILVEQRTSVAVEWMEKDEE